MPYKFKKTNIEYDVETPSLGYIIMGFDEFGNLVYKDDEGNYNRVVPILQTGDYVVLNTDYLTVGVRKTDSLPGLYSIAQGLNISASGETSVARGNFAYADAKYSTAEGQYVEAVSYLSYVHGQGVSNNLKLTSGGINSFVHSFIGDTLAHGTLADYSYILGGRNHDIGSDAYDSGILGGKGVKINSDVQNTAVIAVDAINKYTELNYSNGASISDTVYVPTLHLLTDLRTNVEGE